MKARLVVVLLLSLAAGCSKCGKAAGAAVVPVERVLPKGAVGVVVLPSVGALGDKLKILEALKVAGFVAQLQGFADAKGFSDALVGQVGVDIRSREAMEKAGIDPSRGLGVAVLVSGDAYVALPVKDPAKLHFTLETLSYKRLGAGAGGEIKSGDVVVKTFSPQQGKPPRLGYVIVSGWALVATDTGVQRLAGLATLTESDSLATDALLTTQLERLPAQPDAWGFLPNGSPLLAHAPVTSAVVTASLSPTGLTVSVDAPWKGDAAQLAVLEPRKGPDLTGLLPRDAFLVVRYAGDPQQLAPWVSEVAGPYLTRAFDQGGFDFKAEVLDNVQPGVVAALSLADRPPMDRGLPSFDIRQTNPFTYAHLSGAAATKQADKLLPTMDKVAALAPRFGAEMKKIERSGEHVLFTTYSQGEGVHFAAKGDRVLFGSPVQRLDALLASDGKGGAPVPGLGDEALTLAVDLRKLSASVRALPESAWGLGGFAIKATTVRWLDATDDLEAFTLAIGAKDKAVQARVHLTLGAPPAAGTRAP